METAFVAHPADLGQGVVLFYHAAHVAGVAAAVDHHHQATTGVFHQTDQFHVAVEWRQAGVPTDVDVGLNQLAAQ